MADFIWFLLVVLTLAVASYQRTSLVTAVAMGAGVMILGTLFGDIGLLGWVVFCLTLPFTLANIRQQHISKKLLGFYRKVMPEMSSTEQEATTQVRYGGTVIFSAASQTGINYTAFRKVDSLLKSKHS